MWVKIDVSGCTTTMKMKVEGGYLYHVFIEGAPMGINSISSSICYVPVNDIIE